MLKVQYLVRDLQLQKIGFILENLAEEAPTRGVLEVFLNTHEH